MPAGVCRFHNFPLDLSGCHDVVRTLRKELNQATLGLQRETNMSLIISHVILVMVFGLLRPFKIFSGRWADLMILTAVAVSRLVSSARRFRGENARLKPGTSKVDDTQSGKVLPGLIESTINCLISGLARLSFLVDYPVAFSS